MLSTNRMIIFSIKFSLLQDYNIKIPIVDMYFKETFKTFNNFNNY